MKNEKIFPPLVEDKKAEEIRLSASENIIETKLNIQRNAYQLTINNPLTEGLDHTKIKEVLTLNFSTLVYFCLADEIAETGTPHTHIYVVFRSRVRWSTVKKHFPTAHIEVATWNTSRNPENGEIQKNQKQAYRVLLRNGVRDQNREEKMFLCRNCTSWFVPDIVTQRF